ncbi:A24 family peptidase [archaeon]|nr:A24 family peptidase [archaeon]
MIDLILIIITTIFLVIATISDIRTREVPDFISYILFPLAILTLLYVIIFNKQYDIILPSILTFLIFLAKALIMYYSKQWGGGDTKLLIALSLVVAVYPKTMLNYFSPNLNFSFPLIFIINLLLFGALYGFIYTFVLAVKNRKKISKLKVNKIFLLPPIVLFIISFFVDPKLRFIVLILALLLLIYPYLVKYIKVIERKFMIKKIPISKLTEGDWVTHDIYYKKKLIYPKKTPGISLEQIKLLKKCKIKNVIIKIGIPFIPSFLIAFIISIIFGNIIPF